MRFDNSGGVHRPYFYNNESVKITAVNIDGNTITGVWIQTPSFREVYLTPDEDGKFQGLEFGAN